MIKILSVFFIGFIILLSAAHTTDSLVFNYEANNIVSKIKKGTVFSRKDVSIAVDNSTGENRIFPFKEKEIQEQIESLMDPDQIDPEYQSSFQSFITQLNPKYEELKAEGCTEPIFALLSNIVAELLPEKKKESTE